MFRPFFFPRFTKILDFFFFGFRSIETVSRPIKKLNFQNKTLCPLRSLFDQMNSQKPFPNRCSIPLNQLNFKNFKFLRLDRSILLYSFFLFNSSRSLFLGQIFLSYSESKLQRFSSLSFGKTLLPFLYYYFTFIHA